MEVCVDSLESALAAYNGGANRIELCSSLNEGGLTPTLGLYRSIKRHLNENFDFKIFVMIRPRVGDFLYNENEVETLKEDLRIFTQEEVDGFVFGCLTKEGLVDESLAKEFLDSIPKTKSTTFHRAFDVTSDWQSALKSIMNLGFTRLLTSGQEKSAYEGRHLIKKCVEYSNDKLIILPGAGITSDNLEEILALTGCKEFHASCKTTRESRMICRNEKISMGSPIIDEFTINTTDSEKVKLLSKIFNNFIFKQKRNDKSNPNLP